MKHTKLLIAFLVFTCILLTLIGCSPITCKDCDKIILTNSSFCSNCGASIDRGNNHVHDFSIRVLNFEYKKSDATCESPAIFYYSCECGEKGTETFEHGTKSPYHSFTQKVASYKYLSTNATCSKPAQYYYSCKCGLHNSDVFSYGETSHSFVKQDASEQYLCSAATKSSAATYYFSCESCGKKGTKTFEYGTPLKDSWFSGYYIDYQFLEPTDDWYIKTWEMIDGTFENSATDDSPLLAEILYDCNDEITIFLYEYANTDNLVKNSSSKYKDYYEIVIKNEKGRTYEARGQMHPGGDRIYVIDTYHNSVLDLMKTSQTLRFYIRFEDSPTTQYRFEVDMTNFNDVLDSMK